jgi:DNA-binding transcriptional LysR family regulator
MRMELRHLRYFVAVAEEENVSKAAGKLRVSQPGISRQIRDLEDEIGFALFERSAKSIRLTAAGKAFLAGARELLQQSEAFVKKARAVAAGSTEEINVGYAPSLTVQLLPPILRAFQEQLPQVRVALYDLSSDEMMTQLAQKKLQVVLTVPPSGKMSRGLAVKELARYATVVAVAPNHPFAKLKAIVLKQVASEPIIGLNRKDYPEYHVEMKKLFAAVGSRPNFAEEHEGGTGIIAAVEAGRGVALVPSSLACIVGARVKLLPIKPALPPIPVGAVWLKENESELVKRFIAAASPAK